MRKPRNPLQSNPKTGTSLNKLTFLLEKMLSGAVFGLLMGTVVLILLLFSLHLTISHLLPLIITLLLSSVVFSLLGTLISVSVREVFEAMTLSNFFRFPMIFLCGVFIPITSMPDTLKLISYFLPLTYSVDALRQCLLNDQGVLNIYIDVLVLLAYAVLLFIASTAVFKGRLLKEY